MGCCAGRNNSLAIVRGCIEKFFADSGLLTPEANSSNRAWQPDCRDKEIKMVIDTVCKRTTQPLRRLTKVGAHHEK
jgi:hypothetical protein